MARNQGVPPSCRISFRQFHDGRSDVIAAGCAGFLDAPRSFEQPFILLNPALAFAVKSDQVLDVYCGIALHESAHILFSRELFVRRVKSRYRRIFLNLWEDERIEALLRLTSPGYSCYLEALRQFMVGQLKGERAHWNHMAELHRLLLLIHCFIRCPEIVTAEMREWQPIPHWGPPFVQLRTKFLHDPADATDSISWSKRTEKLWSRFRRLYPDTPMEYLRMRRQGTLDDRNATAVIHQLEADAIERVEYHQRQALEDTATCSDARRMLKDEAEAFYGAAKQADDVDACLLKEAGDRLAALAENTRRTRNRPRFGLLKMEEMVAGSPLPADGSTQQELAVAMAGESECEDDDAEVCSDKTVAMRVIRSWQWGDTGKRQTFIEWARPTAASRHAVELARAEVSRHSASLRTVLKTMMSRDSRYLRDQRYGSLDASRLWRAPFDERLFRQQFSAPDYGLSIGLLVDESGSMFHSISGDVRRIDLALQVTVMIACAVEGIEAVELEVYSHCSDAQTNRNCLLRYLYGRENRQIASLAAWAEGIMNYDHEAIPAAAEMFRKNTTHDNRWLIVIGDGGPSGVDYDGQAAVCATRTAVQAVRRGGTRVFGVAIADFCADDIFGEQFVLQCDDLEQLVQQMRRLITTIARPW